MSKCLSVFDMRMSCGEHVNGLTDVLARFFFRINRWICDVGFCGPQGGGGARVAKQGRIILPVCLLCISFRAVLVSLSARNDTLLLGVFAWTQASQPWRPSASPSRTFQNKLGIFGLWLLARPPRPVFLLHWAPRRVAT